MAIKRHLHPSPETLQDNGPDPTRIPLKQTIEKMREALAAQSSHSAQGLARQARAMVGMTQRDFASMLGISMRKLAAWEKGRGKPSTAEVTLMRVCMLDPGLVKKLTPEDALPNPRLALLCVDHIHIFVKDRYVAESWYERVLGLKRTAALEFWAVADGPLTLQNREGTIQIALFKGSARRNRATVAMRVEQGSFQGWLSHLETIPGLLVTYEDHIVSESIYFADPDGNPYEITSYRPGKFPSAH
ncbi:MAG: helix-turn-helix domain-containing protein [Burkholderiaceae bacterium]